MGKRVLCAVPTTRARLFRTPEAFALVVTDRRTILVPLTANMLAKAAGKGFLGRWGAQLQASLGYTQRYLTMDPGAILRDCPDHQTLENLAVSSARLHARRDPEQHTEEWELVLAASAGKLRLRMPTRTREMVAAFRRAWGNAFRG